MDLDKLEHKRIYKTVNILLLATVIVSIFLFTTTKPYFILLLIGIFVLFNGVWSVNRSFYSFIHRNLGDSLPIPFGRYLMRYMFIIFIAAGFIMVVSAIIKIIG